MPLTFDPFEKPRNFLFDTLFQPVLDEMAFIDPLESRGNRELKMDFEDHLRALVFFHLHEHKSGQHLLQVLEQDDYARKHIAPKDGIKKSSFSEATNTRGLEQFIQLFERLQARASHLLPKRHAELGNLIGIDGSLIDATLSMDWADYRKISKKAKVHVGFDLNRSIPRKVFLTDGKGAERPFVSRILSEDETGVMDRGYQCHQKFDVWQADGKLFMCRIKASTRKTIVEENEIQPGASFFSMQWFYWEQPASIRPKHLCGWSVMKWTG